MYPASHQRASLRVSIRVLLQRRCIEAGMGGTVLRSGWMAALLLVCSLGAQARMKVDSQTVPADRFAAAKSYFLSADFGKAADLFQSLAVADPANAQYALWLGRAYERQSEITNPIRSQHYAALARQTFERAAALEPRNSEILRELLDSYLNSDRFRGSDWHHASAVAEQLSDLGPFEAKVAADRLNLEKQMRDVPSDAIVHLVQLPADLAGALVSHIR